ncbi:autotransporter outer membrane beta-barrel domain-containing protein [Desulfovibrio sp.]|uniref:autotransporter family protein n=1 Tax=Desulfovibrio sp. TaxID=885 RepID=UPI003AB3671B
MLTISDSTFQNNSATTAGGAIYNAGTLTLTGDNLFSGNTAAEGKDIYNEGDITFDGTNTQMDGGMMMAKGTMAVNNSQVSMAELTAKGGEISVTGSELTVSQLTDTTLGSTLTVGTDGIVNIGNLDTTKLGEAMNDASMGSGSAVLALNTSVTLADGARLVVGNDGSKGAAAASFGDNSLLVVDAEGVTGNQVIHADGSGNKTAFIHSGAQLRIINAVAGESVTVLNGFDTIKNEDGTLDAKWVNNEGVENLDYMLSSYAQIVDDNGQYDVIVVSELNDPTEALPGIDPDLAPVLNEVWANKLNDVDSPDMGVRFLSRAARADYVNGDAAKSAATIESAARIAFAGAVPQMTKMASDAATNAVVNRLGFANPADGAQAMNAEGQIVDRNTTGFALWIAPLWQSQHGWGMEAGNLDYGFNGNLGGISLGADYTFENAIRAGITFNIGGGYAETSGGDLNSTQNNMNFWGLGAYAGWNYENFAVMADVSYTSTWNQLEQDLDPGMGMGDLEADVQATAISAGLRAEYKLETSVLDIIPHVGVRYMSLNTWGYDVDARGGTVMEGDGFHQDIWTFPVGVTFSKDFTLDSGWFFKPSLDFSVIPAAGDIKAKEDVRFTGAPAVAEMETQMMDYLTWQGGVGLEMGNDTMSFGVNYTLQAGQHTTGHGVFGSFRYEF